MKALSQARGNKELGLVLAICVRPKILAAFTPMLQRDVSRLGLLDRGQDEVGPIRVVLESLHPRHQIRLVEAFKAGAEILANVVQIAGELCLNATDSRFCGCDARSDIRHDLAFQVRCKEAQAGVELHSQLSVHLTDQVCQTLTPSVLS